jgi:hypothetical protein
VSRTLSALSWAEVHEIVKVLEKISQPFLESELSVLRSQSSGLQYDGDLTGLPVSNTRRTYPNAAYGHMADEIRLGDQAGVVSLQSPTYGRLWLSVEHHAGDTVSCTQAEALVLAAEKRSRQRPRRRTELLQKRIETPVQSRAPAEKRLATQRAKVAELQRAKEAVAAQLQEATKPKRISVLERRGVRRAKAVEGVRKKLSKTQAWLNGPLEACFRLDAGFGTYENIALERFYTGQTQKHSALTHFGATALATDLSAWFGKYNARQTIEAGSKETKQVFRLRRPPPESALRTSHLLAGGHDHFRRQLYPLGNGLD